jgi:hypothetical protein
MLITGAHGEALLLHEALLHEALKTTVLVDPIMLPNLWQDESFCGQWVLDSFWVWVYPPWFH